MNPLLDFSGLPRFDAVTPEHVAPAIRQLIDENRGLIDRLVAAQTPATWDDFVQPMLDAGERLSRAWGIVGHLHSVNDVPPWREAYNALLPEVSSFYAELGQNLALFAKFKQCRRVTSFPGSRRRGAASSKTTARLPPVRCRAAGGSEAALQGNPGGAVALGAKFSENLLDATNAHAEWITDEADLAGLPEDAKAAAREAAAEDGDVAKRAGWKFTLHAPSYLPVMQFCDNRGLRERMYRAYATRASEFGKAEWDNGPLIERILALRDEEARMLGYTSFAEVSLATKMADTPAQVAAFLRDMAKKARPFAERDVEELRDFARAELGLDTLESWDIAWASEKLKQQRYSFSDDEVKQYFPEPKVLDRAVPRHRIAVCGHAQAGHGAGLAPRCALLPHRAWRPADRASSTSTCMRATPSAAAPGWTRPSPAGASRVACRRRWPTSTAISRRRSASRDATFSHDDVITLFHECGHGLHHLLTQVDELPVSGIHGVEWDAVELPSQFMENFCWEWDVLTGMTAHVDTGAPLPRALYDKMIAAKNFQSGMQTLRQIEFACSTCCCTATPGGPEGVQGFAGGGARGGGGVAAAGMEPLSAELLAHLRRRLCGRLLQLQVGRGALRRRLRGLRRSGAGKRHDAGRQHRRTLLARNPLGRWFAPGAGILQGLPRPRAAPRCLAQAQRHGRACVVRRPNAVPSAPTLGPVQPARTKPLNSRSSKAGSPLLSSTRRRKWVMLSMSIDLQRRPT
jgi:oligopeptidase A